MRFLCDEMLTGLGRWLRAAGYDTVLVDNGLADQALVALARAEDRVLLTCDRALAGRYGADTPIVTLTPEGLDVAARQVRERLGLDWLHAPFTRCLVDNQSLHPATREQIDLMPEPARRALGPFLACPACARVYWPGSHVRRMRARLERWQAGQP